MTQIWSLGQEDPLGKRMATHSNILAWEIPWTRETWWATLHVSKKVRHDWANNTFITGLDRNLSSLVSHDLEMYIYIYIYIYMHIYDVIYIIYIYTIYMWDMWNIIGYTLYIIKEQWINDRNISDIPSI